MTKLLTRNKTIVLGLLFLPMFNYAQENNMAASNTSYFSNALFNTLLALIIGLLIVIYALSQTLKNIADSDYLINKATKNNEKTNNSDIIKKTGLFLILLTGFQMKAETPVKPVDNWLIGGLDMLTFYSMISIIVIECIITAVLYVMIMGFIKTEKRVSVQVPKTKTILEKLNASVDVEKEQDIMLDHDYDGIKELDNDLPPWWKYGFYLTIIIAVIYLINFHVIGTGDLQTAEYNKAMAQAKLEVEEYMKTAANNVDETNVKQLEGADIESGKQLFIANCAACHGKLAQGSVGPNLTDDYWLHGGSLPDVFKTIKYGWVDKGMKSWKEDLSPVQIAQISGFIKTLKGSNPPEAKAPQGDLFKEEQPAAIDSSAVGSNTLTLKADSIK
ncbi:MAG: cbb3-type cytochrome c oxidase N-terminal domain-containing protein [Bacteroidota bacterium]